VAPLTARGDVHVFCRVQSIPLHVSFLYELFGEILLSAFFSNRLKAKPRAVCICNKVTHYCDERAEVRKLLSVCKKLHSRTICVCVFCSSSQQSSPPLTIIPGCHRESVYTSVYGCQNTPKSLSFYKPPSLSPRVEAPAVPLADCLLCDTHPGVRDLELSQDVLRHVVFRHGVYDKVLVPGRALRWPVLMALFLPRERKVSVSPRAVGFALGLSLAHTYPPHLAKLGQHHDNGGVVLPQHPPEILRGLCQWPLSGDVCLLLSATEPKRKRCVKGGGEKGLGRSFGKRRQRQESRKTHGNAGEELEHRKG